MKSNLFLIALLSFTASAHAADPSYAGQQTRAIKALSADERDALIAGAGMGYARAAELNRHPGPMHALELKTPLGLSAEVVDQMNALMKRHKMTPEQIARYDQLHGSTAAPANGGTHDGHAH